MPPPQFTFGWSGAQEGCQKCGEPLHLRVTRRRRVLSIAHGKFLALERQGYCPVHPRLPPARSWELDRLVPRGANVAYDVIVRVGLARFLQCRQIGEIQAELASEYGIELPARTIAYQAQKFVAYVEVVHQESVRLLRTDMSKRGGYILHIDGTCEEGSWVLLVCLDSLSEQVLESRKIASESTEEVREVLRGVRQDWGVPLGVVHDLRKSLIIAAGEAFPGVPQFVCHYHLAADVGKDILSAHVDSLRGLFRHTKVRPRLGALCRSLREFAVAEELGEHVVSRVLQCTAPQTLQAQVTPEATQGTIHALISWILAFSRTTEGYGFPFDLPYLNLYERIVAVHRVLDPASIVWPEKSRGVIGALHHFKEILDPVVVGEYGEDFRQLVAETRRDQRIFERFRATLRICPKGGTDRRNDEGTPSTLNPVQHKAMRKKLRASLLGKSRRDENAARACKIVVEHLDKYWDYLFGHAVRNGQHPIVVPRTNNVEERLFRTIKRQCRRLHGRGHLSRDVDAMAAGTALVLNLSKPEYCQTVYGGTDPKCIAERFSRVDPKKRAELMETWRRERLAIRIPRKYEGLEDLPRRLAPFIAAASEALQKEG